MGRNIPWRKALTFTLLLITFTSINSSPIKGKNHPVMWKSAVENSSKTVSNRNNYKKDKHLTFDISNSAINSQLKKVDKKSWSKYLKTTYNRLLPYRDFIAEEAEKQNVPIELMYLPIIESGAYPMAKSRRGATGLWQFMSNSSGAYDMHTTEWLDERRDFVKSTRGAISKLSYNYKKTGDWLLALAAYNCGLNRVLTVMKNSGIDNFWEMAEKRLLPKETINYIPKFLAVSSLFMKKNNYNIPVKWDKTQWVELPLTHAVDLRMLSKRANIPLETLIKGNYELNYTVTPPTNTKYKLKVPTIYKENVLTALSQQEQLLEFYRYKVKSGDTHSEIGYHYGISTNGLIKYNPGVSARNLRVGKTLLVPAIKKTPPYEKYKSTGPFKNDYIVKEGDTLWDISLKYDTTVEEIALNSGLPINGYIKKGMRLKVP